MERFRKKDGSLDLGNGKSQKILVDDRCEKCNRYFINLSLFRNNGRGESVCSLCNSIDSEEEFDHDKYVRCPECGYVWEPIKSEDYVLLEDGDHIVVCQECDCSFNVSTTLSWNFNSPPKNKKIKCT